jgi:2'-5' RNA ligase
VLRSFIAFKPPEDITRRIGQLQSQLHSEGVAARWVKPSNIHLTLKFLGETDPDKAGNIRDAMQAAVAGHAPLELALGGLGGFPNLSRPRVIWLGVAQDIDRLKDIQQQLEARLARHGFQPEHRPYRAHLTIGRIRHPKRWGTRTTAAVRQIPANALQPFTLDKLIWYQSRLHPGGAEYTALAKIPLAQS